MLKMGVLGKKLGMTQIFDKEGNRVPVTVIQAGPNFVLDVKTPEKHGYSAIKLGFDDQKESRLTKPKLGQFKKAGVTPKKFVREIRLDTNEAPDFKVGQELKIENVFKQGDPVDVTGTSKGRGFQGVMKRHNFRGFIQTHGTHEYFRHGGSIGCSATPARVVKGRKMPGQMGNKKVTVQNMKIVEIRPEEHLILIQGGVPGPKNGYVTVRFSAKKRVYL